MKIKNKKLIKDTRPILEWLKNHGYKNEIVTVTEAARSAQEAADSLGVSLGQIAKSLIFMTKDTKKPILVITSGSNRVNEKAIAEIIEGKIERAEANWVKEITGFSIGGIPPVAHKTKAIVLFDEDLCQYDEIWAAAGHPYAVFKTTPTELIKMSKSKIISVR